MPKITGCLKGCEKPDKPGSISPDPLLGPFYCVECAKCKGHIHFVFLFTAKNVMAKEAASGNEVMCGKCASAANVYSSLQSTSAPHDCVLIKAEK